jgi:hypothetical protein
MRGVAFANSAAALPAREVPMLSFVVEGGCLLWSLAYLVVLRNSMVSS